MRVNADVLRATAEATHALIGRTVASLEADPDWHAHAVAAEIAMRWLDRLKRLGPEAEPPDPAQPLRLERTIPR